MMVQTLIPYVLVAAGLAGALALFWSLKRELRSAARTNAKQIEQVRLEAREQREQALANAPAVTQPLAAPVFVAAGPRSGFNLSKRAQAMRLARRGEDASHIAAVLGTPRREVELLIRVHQISSQRAERPDHFPAAS